MRGGFSDLQDCSDNVLGVVQNLRRDHAELQIQFASPGRVISHVRDQALPRLSGEMPFGWGSISSGFATLMKQSAELEHSLLTLEKITALASAAGVSAPAIEPRELAAGKQYWKLHKGIENDIFGDRIQESQELRELWRYELLCQDHNYAGRHGAQSNWDKEVWREHALQEVAHRIDNGLRSLAQPGTADSLVIFNPVSWPRNEVAIVPDEKPETLQAMASDGTVLPSQPVSQGLAIQADQVPSLGSRTVSLVRGEPQAKRAENAAGSQLVGEHDEVDVDVANGQISRLYDRAIGHDLLRASAASAGHGLGELMSYKDPGVDVLYNFTGEVESDSNANYRVICNENGPILARITLSGSFLNSQVEKEYTVYKKLRRVDVALRVWWWGKRGEHLRLRFPFTTEGYVATWYGVPFYRMRWPEMLNGDDASANSVLGQEEFFSDMLRQDDRHHFREVIGWLDVGYDAHGIGIGTQSTCWWIAVSELQASLLRTQYSCGDTDLWNLNTGFHEWKFRIEPHAGDWREGKAYRKGEENLNRLATLRAHNEPGTLSAVGVAPKLASVEVHPQSVIVTAVKPSDLTSGGLVLRVLECEGQPANVSVRFPFPVRSVDLVDLREKETSHCDIDDQAVSFPLRPYQFQTIRVIPR